MSDESEAEYGSNESIVPAPPLPPPPPPRPVMSLEYGQGRSGPKTPAFLRFLIGFVGYIVVSAAWFWIGFAVGASASTVWLTWAAMTCAAFGVALYVRIRYRFSGVGYGIAAALLLAFLLIVGLVLLIIGLCASKPVA